MEFMKDYLIRLGVSSERLRLIYDENDETQVRIAASVDAEVLEKSDPLRRFKDPFFPKNENVRSVLDPHPHEMMEPSNHKRA